jgi:subtilisin family serine protease
VRRRTLTIVIAAVCGTLTSGAPALAAEKAGDVIPGHYIVVVKQDRDAAAVARWQDARDRHVFSSVHGFAATLDAAQVTALRQSARVAYVEPDRVVTAATTQTMDATGQPWGLDRIDQRALPLSRTYTWTHNGQGVRAYVIDTGIATGLADFGGRASNVYDALGGNGADCNGHGTHVAGTIGGATYGVAKSALLRGVRVLNCSGSGSTSGIIRALDWVRTHAIKPAVANMSLGGSYSSTLNSATAALANSGVFVAVAAGNSGLNACNYSPSSTAAAYTTAASDRTDLRASWSNYGSCVDGYAPGVSVKSDWYTGGTNTISGTSMASPHAAGVAALYKSTFGDAASSTVASWINTNATAGVIRSNPSGTANRLLDKAGL